MTAFASCSSSPLRPARRLPTFVCLAIACVGVAWSGVMCSVAAQDSSEALLAYDADLVLSDHGTDFARATLGQEVLSAMQPDFADLRVFDARGDVVEHAIYTPGLVRTRATREAVPMTPILVDESTSRAGGIARATERLTVSLPMGLPRGATTRIEFAPSQSGDFVRQVLISPSAPGPVTMSPVRASIYRYAAGSRLSVEVPEAMREWAQIEIEIAGEGSPLRPTLQLVTEVAAGPSPATVDDPIRILDSRTEGTRTVLHLAHDAGFPEHGVLVFGTTTQGFLRSVEVRRVTPSFSETIGRGVLEHLPGATTAAELVVHFDRGMTPLTALEISIENGDSPPLSDLSVSSRRHLPVLVFRSTGTLLRFGGQRIRAAVHGLATNVEGLAAVAAEAAIGSPRPNPRFDDDPVLARATRAGAVVDRSRFARHARLDVPPSRDGISLVEVSPDLAAAARDDLADLRIVDASGAQWPYLRADEVRTTTVRVQTDAGQPRPGTAAGSITHHALRLPVDNVMPLGLRYTLPPLVISRRVMVMGTTATGEHVRLGGAFWSSAGGQPREVNVPLTPLRVQSMHLEIENGDEAPLRLGEGHLALDVRSLYVIAPEGQYEVLVGHGDIEAPRYDIEHFASLLSVVRTSHATLGPLEANPAFVAPSLLSRDGWTTVIASAALAVVVLILLALTWRIATVPLPTANPGTGAPSDASAQASEASTPRSTSTSMPAPEAEPATGASVEAEHDTPGTASSPGGQEVEGTEDDHDPEGV